MKVAEIGITVVIGTSYDMSSKTSLTVELRAPDDTIVTVATGRLSLTASQYSGGGEIFPSNTYMSFTTLATDFPIAGDYTIVPTYNDATPKTFYGTPATMTVTTA